jgi:hypothetical protein
MNAICAFKEFLKEEITFLQKEIKINLKQALLVILILAFLYF